MGYGHKPLTCDILLNQALDYNNLVPCNVGNGMGLVWREGGITYTFSLAARE